MSRATDGQLETRNSETRNSPLAIVGIGCLFPKAAGPGFYWANVKNGVDAVTEVPPTHWDPADYFDADPKRPDMTYARRGGFLDPVPFRPMEFGISPRDIEATDTSQLLGLVAAKQALEDAGIGTRRPVDRDRVSVILGVTGTLELVIPLGARLGHPKWKRAMAAAGVPDDVAEDAAGRIAESYVPWQENSFPGLLGNVVAGRIANKLDLGGTNCVVDAACASSLSAVHLAALELQAGRADVAVTGGVDTFNDIFMYMCFSKTPALSPTGDAKPFDAAGDGTILGEGLGVVVLKRLADAERDGDTVYAVIKGIGSSSDGKGNAIYAPSAAGQEKCLRRAYAAAGVSPETVELVEAHGTGTKVGDTVEATALARVYSGQGAADGENGRPGLSTSPLAGEVAERSEAGGGAAGAANHPPHPPLRGDLPPRGGGEESGAPRSPKPRPWCAVGSVKSQVGHTKAAAGAASLIKAALALHHKVLPPTLKVTDPVEPFRAADSPFYVNTRMRPWLPRADHPRRAALSAFGFGGSNFHAVLEEYRPEKAAPDWDGTVEVVALSAGSAADLLAAVERLPDGDWGGFARAAEASRGTFRADAPHRLCFAAHRALTDLPKLLAGAKARLRSDPGTAWHTPDGVHHGVGPAAGKLAVLFPGQGSQQVGMLRDLACLFPELLDTLAAADEVVGPGEDGRRLSDRIYPPTTFDPDRERADDRELKDTRHAQPALGAVGLGAWRVLHDRFGLAADAFAGHSYGELVALAAAGRFGAADLFALSRLRGDLMARRRDGDPGAMLAVVAPPADAERVLRDHGLGLVVANRNAPRQTVLSGPTADVERAETVFAAAGVKSVRLPVAAAFHSPLVADAAGPLRAALGGVAFAAGSAPVYANTTAAPYPADPEAAKDLLANQLANPVGFVDQVRALAGAGVRTFVEVGPGAVLTRLVEAILADAGITDAAAVALDGSAGKRPGVLDLGNLLARLAARGIPVRLAAWEEGSRCRPPEPAAGTGLVVPICGANHVNPREPRPPRRVEAVAPAGPGTAAVPAAPPSADERPGRPRSQEPARPPVPVPDFRPSPSPGAFTPASPGPRPTGPAEMPPMPDPLPADPSALALALQATQQSLAAVQRMQEQTALLHRQFLDGQEAAQRTLQTLVEQQQALLLTGLGAGAPLPALPPPAYAPPPPAAPLVPPAPAPVVSAQYSVSPPPVPLPPTTAPAASPGTAAVPAAPTAVEERPGRPRSQDNRAEVEAALIEVVAEKTGYPAGSLSLGLALDADLGVDSIKRVEILSALQDRLPAAPRVGPEHLGRLHTLQDVADFLAGPAADHTGGAPVPQPPGSPAPPGANTPGSPVPVGEVAQALIEVVAEKTGYPAGSLSLGLALDADLGVDSIKRVEILSALQDRLPAAPRVGPEHLGRLHTLQDVADFLAGRAGGPPEAPATAKIAVPPPPPAAPAPAVPAPGPASRAADRIDRSILQAVDLDPAAPRPRVALPPGAEVWVVGEPGDLTDAVAAEFRRRGYHSRVGGWSPAGLPGAGSPAGLVLLAPVAPGPDSGLNRLAFEWLKLAGPGLRAAGRSGGAAFATVARLDGAFGLGDLAPDADPTAGGLAGLAKTARHEWPEVASKAIDLDPHFVDPTAAAAAVADEVLLAGPAEVGVAARSRCTLEPARAVRRPADGPPLGPGDVVLVTGGGRGVTAECAVALAAAFRPTLVLTGRTPPPGPEPDWMRDLSTEAAIKEAIAGRLGSDAGPRKIGEEYQRVAAQREVRRTLKRIRDAGGRAEYLAADAADPAAVAHLLNHVRTRFGPVAALVHGAGVLADKRIEDLAPADFERVYRTKVDGLRHLLAGLAADPLRAVVLFSSVTARLGRTGQAAYAAANEVLNKTAQAEARRRPGCRVVAVNWGPWDGGMVTPALRKQFEAEGVGVVGLADGGAFLADELAAAGRAVEVLALGRPGAAPPAGARPATPPPADLALAFERAVDIDSHPVLGSHVIDGRAVLPVALHLEFLAHAALHGNPGLVFHGVNDLRITKGVTLGPGEAATVRAFAGRAAKRDGQLVVPVELRARRGNGQDAVRSRAEVVLVPELPPPPAADRPPALPPYPVSVDRAYADGLFHGPALRGLLALTGMSDAGMTGTARPAPPPADWLRAPHRSAWVADPLVLDGSFQMMCLWCRHQHGATSLPSFVGRFRQFRRRFPDGPVTVAARVTRDNGTFVRADLDYRDADGAVVAQVQDYECMIDPKLNAAFRRNRLEAPATA